MPANEKIAVVTVRTVPPVTRACVSPLSGLGNFPADCTLVSRCHTLLFLSSSLLLFLSLAHRNSRNSCVSLSISYTHIHPHSRTQSSTHSCLPYTDTYTK